MRTWATIALITSLVACSDEPQRIDPDPCSEENPCLEGQICEFGICADSSTTDGSDTPSSTEPDDPAPTTDASWPSNDEQYTSSHLTLLTSLELAPTSEGNKFGDLLRFLANQAEISVEGYFDDYLRNGQIVSLVDHQAIASTSESQAFLLSHLSGSWAEGMNWETATSGQGNVHIAPENFTEGSAQPRGAYETATLIDGNLLGQNGNLLLNIPEGNVLTSINIHESQLMADSITLSNEGISYPASLSGWVSIAEFYESVNRAFEHLCSCAGIEESQNVWTEIEPGTYECEPDAFNTDNCAETENEELCASALPLCATLTYALRGDLDIDPNIPNEDAMSVLLDIEATSVTLLAIPMAESTEEDSGDSN